MTKANNCAICAKEFNIDDLQTVALSKINITKFKICQACLDRSDPSNDYAEVKKIVSSYLKFSEAKHCFSEAKEILNSRKQ